MPPFIFAANASAKMKTMPSFLAVAALIFFSGCKQDEAPVVVPEIQFPIDISGLENEENRFFEFPLVMNQSTTRDVIVYFETRPITAEENSDYIPVQDSLIIRCGTASATTVLWLLRCLDLVG